MTYSDFKENELKVSSPIYSFQNQKFENSKTAGGRKRDLIWMNNIGLCQSKII